MSGASTRPRRVSVSGVLWFWSLNCRKEGDGNPCPTPPYPGFCCLQGCSLLWGCGPPGSCHSPSVHQVAVAAPHTGVSGVPHLPAPAPDHPLEHSIAVGAWCWLAPTAPTALCPLFLPALAKRVSQRSTCPAVTQTKSCPSTSSSPGQAARRITVYRFTRWALSSAPARSVTCHGDTVTQQGACQLLPYSLFPSHTSAWNLVASVGSELMAMELKGWSGLILSRVTLGLLLELLQDTVTSATRVPDTASSLRATTRGKSGRTGGRPQGSLMAHPAVQEPCPCT